MRPQINILQSVYAAADYILGALLIVAPWMFGFSDHSIAMGFTAGFGIAVIIYSALTDYQLAVSRQVPLPVHFATDAIVGGLLIGAPFMLGFSHRVWVPHMVIGIVMASLAAAAALGYMIRHTSGRLMHERVMHRRSERVSR